MLETLHTHKKTKQIFQTQPIFTNLKKRFEHIELPAKLQDYFLRSNKSNINQSVVVYSRAFGLDQLFASILVHVSLGGGVKKDKNHQSCVGRVRL